MAVYERLCVTLRWGEVDGLLETPAYTHMPACAARLEGGNETIARSLRGKGYALAFLVPN